MILTNQKVRQKASSAQGVKFEMGLQMEISCHFVYIVCRIRIINRFDEITHLGRDIYQDIIQKIHVEYIM